jgi:hypothetical protein
VTVILARHLLQTALEVKKIGRAIETHEKLYMYQVSKVPYKLKSCHVCFSTCPNGTDHQRDVPATNTVMLSNMLSPVTHRRTGLQLTKAKALANRMREVSWTISVSPISHLSIYSRFRGFIDFAASSQLQSPLHSTRLRPSYPLSPNPPQLLSLLISSTQWPLLQAEAKYGAMVMKMREEQSQCLLRATKVPATPLLSSAFC